MISSGTEPITPPPALAAGMVRLGVIAFLLICPVLLIPPQADNLSRPLAFAVREGIAADLLAELPRGRQALVSVPWALPLPTMLSLPLVPLLGSTPPALRLAYLLALAMTLAAAAPSLARLLRHWRLPCPSGLALLALAVLALIGRHSDTMGDLVFCLGFLIHALAADISAGSIGRALAAPAYGLAMLCHPIGFGIALLRLLLALGSYTFAGSNRERRAVAWIQAVGIAYLVLVLLFLNWMIMLDPWFCLRHSKLPRSSPEIRAKALVELADILAKRYPAYAPVISGIWGYQARKLPGLVRSHHFLDFHPDRLPDWERRPFLLVVPRPGNPLYHLADLADPGQTMPSCLFLAEDPRWRYYRVWSR